MIKCYHTGLPITMCAHCNMVEAPVDDPFHPHPVEDETPRFVMGRDQAEWRGLGTSTGSVGSFEAGKAAASQSRRGPWDVAKSDWAWTQLVRTVVELAASVPRELTLCVPCAVEEPKLPPVRYDEVGTPTKERVAPPVNHARPVPRVFNYEHCRHARAPKQVERRRKWMS